LRGSICDKEPGAIYEKYSQYLNIFKKSASNGTIFALSLSLSLSLSLITYWFLNKYNSYHGSIPLHLIPYINPFSILTACRESAQQALKASGGIRSFGLENLVEITKNPATGANRVAGFFCSV